DKTAGATVAGKLGPEALVKCFAILPQPPYFPRAEPDHSTVAIGHGNQEWLLLLAVADAGDGVGESADDRGVGLGAFDGIITEETVPDDGLGSFRLLAAGEELVPAGQ